MSKRRNKSSKKKGRVVSVGKQVLAKIRLQPRVEALEKFRAEYIESAEHKVKFDASVLFSVNGLVRALLDKDVVTMDELNKGRDAAVQEYIAERKRDEEVEAKKKILVGAFKQAQVDHPDWTGDQCKEAARKVLDEAEKAKIEPKPEAEEQQEQMEDEENRLEVEDAVRLTLVREEGAVVDIQQQEVEDERDRTVAEEDPNQDAAT